jgi:glyoxylase-like metal-dependent hydrolase (beta-lactamase superfamily II)
MKPSITFPYQSFPADKLLVELVPGVYWVKIALNSLVSHVNAYILEEENGLTIIDTGISSIDCKNMWEKIFLKVFKGKKIIRVIVTHHHPDHLGLVGWFYEKFHTEIWSSRVAFLTARMLTLDAQETTCRQTISFWYKAGMPAEMLSRKTKERPFNFGDYVDPIPVGYRRVKDNERISIGKNDWFIKFGNGHAPDHLTLRCPSKNIFIVGDQVLPGISPNLSVYPTEPLANPVEEFLATCENFLKIEDKEYLVLPGHNLPFWGFKYRVQQLLEHHQTALLRMSNFLKGRPRLAVETFGVLYGRTIRESEFSLALGEAVGHLNCLWHQKIINRKLAEDGKLYYELSKN